MTDEILARVARSEIELDRTIDGRALLAIGPTKFEGDGQVMLSRAGIDLTIKMDLKSYLNVAGHETGFVVEPLERPVEYGKLIPKEFVGTAVSLDPSAPWTAELVYSNGVGAQTVGSQHFSNISAKVGRLVLSFGPPGEKVAYLRHVYEGAYLKCSATFLGHRALVRSQKPSNQETATIAITLEASEISETNGEVLWLWLSFLSGCRLRAICDEAYGSQGQLLSRSIQLGGPPSKTPVPPIPFHSLTANQATLIGEGFRRMVESGFPIEIILDYVHTSADAIQMEMQMMLLLVAIHASAEAWAQLPVDARGKKKSRFLVLDNGFEAVRDELTGVVASIANHLPTEIIESVIKFINGANYTSMNSRVDALFSDLGLDVTEEKYALKLRNPLVHTGYVHRSLMDLDVDKQQKHVDAIGHLRNVLNQVILSLCGYTGDAVEYTRNWTFPVVAKPGPFNDINT